MKKEKQEVQMKTVRIDHRTIIEVPANIPDEQAIQSYKTRLENSRKTASGYDMHKSHGQVGKETE